MLAGQLMDMRAMLHKHGVIFAYSGYVTEPVLSGAGEALKQKLTIDDADTKRCAACSPFSSSRCRTSSATRPRRHNRARPLISFRAR